MRKLDGKCLASVIIDEITGRVDRLRQRTGQVPKLAVIYVDDDGSSNAFIDSKLRLARRIPIETTRVALDSAVQPSVIRTIIGHLNKQRDIHGVLVQLPLPRRMNEPIVDRILNEISDIKDVDALKSISSYQSPCAMSVHRCIVDMLGHHDPLDTSVTVIGKGRTAGRPCCEHLSGLGYTVHSLGSGDPISAISSDVIVAATGKPLLLRSSNVDRCKAVVDVGCIWSDDLGRYVGDVDSSSFENRSVLISPVPGGVGPITVAMLMKNVVRAAESQLLG